MNAWSSLQAGLTFPKISLKPNHVRTSLKPIYQGSLDQYEKLMLVFSLQIVKAENMKTDHSFTTLLHDMHLLRIRTCLWSPYNHDIEEPYAALNRTTCTFEMIIVGDICQLLWDLIFPEALVAFCLRFLEPRHGKL